MQDSPCNVVSCGMSEHEWLQPFRQLQKSYLNCYTYAGFWKPNPKNSRCKKIAYFVYNKLMIAVLYIFAMTLLADIYSNPGNLSITTDSGCVFSGMCVVIFKTMNFQFRRERIERLIRETFQCADELCQFSTADAKSILDLYELQNKISSYGFNLLGLILVIALLFFSPLENGLPIRAKYPFDTTISPWHEIGFLIETCAVIGGMVAILVMDFTMILLCTLMILQFDVLGLAFENCNAMESSGNVSSIFQRDSQSTKHKAVSCEGKCKQCASAPIKLGNNFVNDYRRCIRFHQRLTVILKEYNGIFSSSMLVQIASSTSMICLTGFQAVAVGGQSSNVLKFGIYLSAAVGQLLYICWVGNDLTDSGSLIDRSQWLSGWNYEHRADIARLLTLSTMFSRQEIKLNAGVFFFLSLQTFIAIMRGSYSFFTLLNNMHSPGEP